METQTKPTGTPAPRPVKTLVGALWEEFTAIHGEAPKPADRASLAAYASAACAKHQTALCLSGGGIRSAAFSLGVLQALARKQLLTQFHYLSTVSGGGYIGGWLTALIHAHGGDAAEVQQALGAAQPPPELRTLRGYTNFLTPQPGLASPDTWAGMILWLRNVLVNWMLFLPGLFSLVLAPLMYRDLITTIDPGWGTALLVTGLICLWVGVYCGAAHLPSHAPADDRRPSTAPAPGMSFAIRFVVVPTMVWAFLVPLVAAPSLRLVMAPDAAPMALIPFGSFCVMIAAYVVAGWRSDSADRRVFRRNLHWWIISAALAALVLNVGLTLGLNQPPIVLAVLGPLWVTVAHLLQSLFYVALRSNGLRGDMDREWLARLSAVKVVPAVLWAGFAAVCLLLPPLILEHYHSTFRPWLLGVVGVVTGPGVAFVARSTLASFGRGGKDAGDKPRVPVNIVIAIGTAIFAALLFMLLAKAADSLSDAFAPPRLDGTLPAYRCLVELLLGLLSFGLAYELGRRINVNRFSMHAVYRNRLVRGFLGSARVKREPDAFTGLDPHDNPRMTDVFSREGPPRPLFPVVNLTLNLTVDSNNAWNERKAASFTVTPLASGSAVLRRREDAAAGRPPCGAYVTTSEYAGNERETGPEDPMQGVSLGTAVTLSGAAVSPNMGYHSSAAAAFLMTLFNVRLGAWLPNPASATTEQLREAKPPNALFTLAREMLGRSDDVGPAVYLSDGGHFEDLGLYEMIRRRCAMIVVVDAGEDEDALFTDLGNAVRKVFIDFGVIIRFDPPMEIGSRAAPLPPIRGHAYATIDYQDGGPEGQLLYLRPFDLPDVRVDVRAFRNANATFPHETTLNQWFSESRFESYRALGDAAMSALGPPAGCTLAQFIAAARTRLETDVAHRITADA